MRQPHRLYKSMSSKKEEGEKAGLGRAIVQRLKPALSGGDGNQCGGEASCGAPGANIQYLGRIYAQHCHQGKVPALANPRNVG